VTDRDLRRALLRIHAPDEIGAERRAWGVVRTAFEARQPTRRGPSVVRPLLAFAVALALVAAIVNPPVLDAIRDAVKSETKVTTVYKPALFSLPAGGRLLVNSAQGPWVVKPGGGKRLLGPYRDASWSPHGRFVAALGPHAVVALEPNGDVHWSLARSGTLASPRWSPEIAGSTRIAYLRDRTIRLVAGDNTGDRLLDDSVLPVAPAWSPEPAFVVAYVARTGRVRVVEADSGRLLWRSPRFPQPVELAWSQDGTRLLVLLPHSLAVFRRDGTRIGAVRLPADAVAAAFQPRSHRIALVLHYPQRSELVLRNGDALGLAPKLLFGADGLFTGVSWSPDGRWALVGWKSADAFIFVTTERGQRFVSDIGGQFESGAGRVSFPSVAESGWCCPLPG
jgi:hypothetical protein